MYRFLIKADAVGATDVLEVCCQSESDAVEAAKMFAQDAAHVELYEGERRVWPFSR